MRFKNGQSLVEVLVSIGIAVVLAISLISTSLVTFRTTRAARNNTQATKMAQEGIENMRVFRDRVGFTALTNNSCVKLNTTNSDPSLWVLEACPVGPPPGEPITLSTTAFTRAIAIANGTNADNKLITVTITWNDSGGLQTVKNETYLSDIFK